VQEKYPMGNPFLDGRSKTGMVWIVTGTNAENSIEARAASQAEAWQNAVLQAEAVGMAGQFGHLGLSAHPSGGTHDCATLARLDEPCKC
jgi:hypothetical protein